MFILEKIQAKKMARIAEKEKEKALQDEMFESLYGEFYNKSTLKMTLFGFLLGCLYDTLALNGIIAANLFNPGYCIAIACFGWIIGERYKRTKRDMFYHH